MPYTNAKCLSTVKVSAVQQPSQPRLPAHMDIKPVKLRSRYITLIQNQGRSPFGDLAVLAHETIDGNKSSESPLTCV